MIELQTCLSCGTMLEPQRTLSNVWTLESMATAVTMDSRVRHTRVRRTLEYATPDSKVHSALVVVDSRVCPT